MEKYELVVGLAMAYNSPEQIAKKVDLPLSQVEMYIEEHAKYIQATKEQIKKELSKLGVSV